MVSICTAPRTASGPSPMLSPLTPRRRIAITPRANLARIWHTRAISERYEQHVCAGGDDGT